MEEVEKILQIKVYPITWPVGLDGKYKGVYNRLTREVSLFKTDASHGSKQLEEFSADIDDPRIKEMIGEELFESKRCWVTLSCWTWQGKNSISKTC